MYIYRILFLIFEVEIVFGVCRKRTVTGLKKTLEQNDKELLERGGDLFRRGTCDEPYGPRMRKNQLHFSAQIGMGAGPQTPPQG